MTAQNAGIHALVGLDDQAIRCPFPIFKDLRESQPVFYSEELGAWMITRHADIVSVARRPEVFSNIWTNGPKLAEQRAAVTAVMAEREPDLAEELIRLRGGTRALLFTDPPDHRRQRKLVNRGFTPVKIAAVEPRIRAITESLVDAFIDQGEVELVTQFAVPLPLTVIAELLGVPTEDLPEFKKWSDAVVRGIGNNNMTPEETRENMLAQYGFFAYFKEKVADRRLNHRDDLISDVVELTIDEKPLTDPEVLNILIQFLAAGNETTTKLISNAMLTMLRDPELFGTLREDPSQIPDFIEEVLRLESPVQGLYRTALEDAEVAGQTIRRGSHLLLMWAAGNRDEERFQNPDELEIGRRTSGPHLAFGHGEHFCIGAPLARAETRHALEVLLERLGGVRFAPGFDAETVPFVPSFMLHGPSSLPLLFTSRQRASI